MYAYDLLFQDAIQSGHEMLKLGKHVKDKSVWMETQQGDDSIMISRQVVLNKKITFRFIGSG